MPSPGEDIQSWSTTAASNGTADPLIVWSEGQARASVNNSARSMMAAHAKDRNLNNGSIVTTGSGNAQQFLSGLSYTTIPTNLFVRLKIGHGLTNTGPTTINMDGLGDTEIRTTNGDKMRGGELCADGYVDLLYNGTYWIFIYSQQFIDNRFTQGGGLIIGKQIFATAGTFTYTPTDGMECAIIECIGAGGGGGGAHNALSSTAVIGGGGGSGGYSRKLVTAADIGASQTVTIGAGGTGGLGAAIGGTGGTTSVGAFCIANGGLGGTWGSYLGVPAGKGGAGAAPGTGDVALNGAPGEGGNAGSSVINSSGGAGGSMWGGGGAGLTANDDTNGNAGTSAGGGGGGAALNTTIGGLTGGNGAAGIVIITEFAGRGSPGRDGAQGPTGPIGPAGPAGSGTGDVLRFGTPTIGQVARWIDTSHIQGVGSDTIGFGPPQGRLSLSGLVPVQTFSSAAATAIAYSAYVGDKVPLWDGTNWTMTTLPGGFASATTTDTTKNPAAIGANKVNDWFIWNDAGTIRLSHGPDWTNDTTRSAGTALVRVNGIWLNNVAITNACGASRGTYVGTTRSNGTSTLDWIFGGIAAGGTAGVFGVWNAYNRVPVSTIVGDSTDTWTYATATFRAANASNNMRVSYVCGLQEDSFAAEYNVLGKSAVSDGSIIAIGYDSTSAMSGLSGYTNATSFTQIRAAFSTTSLGYHFMQAIEIAQTGAGVTFLGDGGAPTNLQTGLIFDGRL